MLDIAGIQKSFPELAGLKLLTRPSGQKYVFRADLAGQIVALKVFKNGAADQPRAKREIEAVALVKSPRIPPIHDSGTRDICGAEELFIIETFIEGESLRERLSGSPIQSEEFVVKLINSLLETVCEFESQRIVHRDIKPDNIIIDSRENVWLLDLGIVRYLDLQSLTSDGIYNGVGTLGYAAPEQFLNDKAEIDIRADLFAIGVVAYEALAGANPYLKNLQTPRAVLNRMENEDMPLLKLSKDPSGLLAQFISDLIQRFPSRRPQSSQEAITWFEPIKTTYSI